MPWTKTLLSQGRIQYTAPPEASPIKTVIYDPRTGQPKWTITYTWLNQPDDTIAAVETLMRQGQGLT